VYSAFGESYKDLDVISFIKPGIDLIRKSFETPNDIIHEERYVQFPRLEIPINLVL